MERLVIIHDASKLSMIIFAVLTVVLYIMYTCSKHSSLWKHEEVKELRYHVFFCIYCFIMSLLIYVFLPYK